MEATTKKATGHTAGEWRPVVAKNSLGEAFLNYWTVEAGNVRVADLFGEVIGETDEEGEDAHISDAEIEANARLISAAPDLFKACRELVEFCDDPAGSEKAESLAMGLARMLPVARAALAKAEGK